MRPGSPKRQRRTCPRESARLAPERKYWQRARSRSPSCAAARKPSISSQASMARPGATPSSARRASASGLVSSGRKARVITGRNPRGGESLAGAQDEHGRKTVTDGNTDEGGHIGPPLQVGQPEEGLSA